MTTAQIIEFLLALLMIASAIALVTRWLRLPYTIALVIAGFAIDIFHVPINQLLSATGTTPQDILSPDVIFTLFLPVLLFEASINIQIRHLRRNIVPIVLLAIAGVLTATLVTGGTLGLVTGVPLAVTLLFGALISATDPISVLALFKDMGVDKRLSSIVEGESLFNDGTAVVVFQILLAGVLKGDMDIAQGVGRFLLVVTGGAALGLLLGYLASKLTSKVDDPSIEITLTTILAYGSFLAAEHLHVSGVIATVAAGLMVGNFGAEVGMSARTRVALWSFWEYMAFVCNSLVFLLIGIAVHVRDLLSHWWVVATAIAAVLVGRALAVYLLTPISNRFGEPVPRSWQHVLVWGGLHGGVSMALAMSLPPGLPYREALLAMTFGVVAFSIIVQGFTVKPLLRVLKVLGVRESAYDRIKVRQIALSSAGQELQRLLASHSISPPVFDTLRSDLDSLLADSVEELKRLSATDPVRTNEEIRLARLRMAAAEKTAVRRAVGEGFLSAETAERMLSALDERCDPLQRKDPPSERP